MKIRVLIVDDEPLGRKRIQTLLAGDPDIEVIGECSDGQEAIAAIKQNRPDLVYLDVQMPEIDGFAMLDSLAVEDMPAVIFVTAYDRYAVEAFKVHALDYLLKSFDRQRFQDSLQRAKDQILRSKKGLWKQQVKELLSDLRAQQENLTRLVVRSGGRVVFVRAAEIDWLEAADNYVRIHVRGESYLIRETLQSLADRLDQSIFLRIHRSTVVNLDRIKEMHPMFHGEYLVKLQDGTELTLSRNYKEKLTEHMTQFL